jgi:sec-independent protein translocase protein TatA
VIALKPPINAICLYTFSEYLKGIWHPQRRQENGLRNHYSYPYRRKKMELGAPELLLILLIILLLFGVGRIGKVGKELGSGIRAFRQGLQGDEPATTPTIAKNNETVNVVGDKVSNVEEDVKGMDVKVDHPSSPARE